MSQFLLNVLRPIPSANVNPSASLDSFTLSDEMRNKIIGTHDHTHDGNHESFDEDSLFIITHNILNRAIQIIDKVVQVYI